MAMPSGNVVISYEVQGGGGVDGAEMLQYPQYNRQSVPLDERDGFINWIRGEFAAANAIIDSMCDHLKVNGIPGEYDTVIGTIQHRRLNWYPVLQMQQYFSVDEVIRSLHQKALSRRQGRRFGGGYRQGYQRGIEGKNDVSRKPQLDSSSKRSASSQANTSGSAECGAVGVDTKVLKGEGQGNIFQMKDIPRERKPPIPYVIWCNLKEGGESQRKKMMCVFRTWEDVYLCSFFCRLLLLHKLVTSLPFLWKYMNYISATS